MEYPNGFRNVVSNFCRTLYIHFGNKHEFLNMDKCDRKSVYKKHDRWVGVDCRVWEKKSWGWKFLGFSKSQHLSHVLEIPSNDCDHPHDIFSEEFK